MGDFTNAAPPDSRPIWSHVEQHVETMALPGLAVCVVRDGQVEARGFGTRDERTDDPVTRDTVFHVASVGKTAVATAVLQLVESGALALDEPVRTYLPQLPWADPRSARMTLRHLLSHTSGLGDVPDYGWHAPELDDGALDRLAHEVAGWTLERDPGTSYAYSNAAFDLLGHLVARTTGRTFEAHLREAVLGPAGMTTGTYLRSEVPPALEAMPHLGLPPRVVDGAYPYTRRHAPSSTLHASAEDLGRWMHAHLSGGSELMTPAMHDVMWEPQAIVDGEGLRAEMALGWFAGTHRGHRSAGHSGNDPGFQCNIALLPELGLGVAVLSNSNTPVFGLTTAVLDHLLGEEVSPPPPPLPPVTVALAPVLQESGVPAAADLWRRLTAADPPAFDIDDGWFEQAAWGAIELHRTDVVRPLLELWREVAPDSALRWSTTGWAHAVDGDREAAVGHLRRAVELDPDDDEAAAMLGRLSADG